GQPDRAAPNGSPPAWPALGMVRPSKVEYPPETGQLLPHESARISSSSPGREPERGAVSFGISTMRRRHPCPTRSRTPQGEQLWRLRRSVSLPASAPPRRLVRLG